MLRLPHWTDYAVCASTDTELFFPEKGKSAKAAKRICGKCPAKEECLAEAEAMNQPYGVWGGVLFQPRTAINRKVSNVTQESISAPDPEWPED